MQVEEERSTLYFSYCNTIYFYVKAMCGTIDDLLKLNDIVKIYTKHSCFSTHTVLLYRRNNISCSRFLFITFQGCVYCLDTSTHHHHDTLSNTSMFWVGEYEGIGYNQSCHCVQNNKVGEKVVPTHDMTLARFGQKRFLFRVPSHLFQED